LSPPKWVVEVFTHAIFDARSQERRNNAVLFNLWVAVSGGSGQGRNV
jgi:hypothetical protein